MLWIVVGVQGSEHSHPVRIGHRHGEAVDARISCCDCGVDDVEVQTLFY